jgi:hypothetical protein
MFTVFKKLRNFVLIHAWYIELETQIYGFIVFFRILFHQDCALNKKTYFFNEQFFPFELIIYYCLDQKCQQTQQKLSYAIS